MVCKLFRNYDALPAWVKMDLSEKEQKLAGAEETIQVIRKFYLDNYEVYKGFVSYNDATIVEKALNSSYSTVIRNVKKRHSRLAGV